MSATIERVQAEALTLPLNDRARIAHRLLESLDEDLVEDPSEVAHAWEAEISRRVEDYRRGNSQTTAASEVFAEARSRLKQG
ncbi:MAG: addiction module protein [Gemmatimonadota bacterium]